MRRPEGDVPDADRVGKTPPEEGNGPEMTDISRGTGVSDPAKPGESLPKRILVRFFVGLIGLYRVALSPLFAGACRFQPSCSRYAEEAVILHGPWRGILLAARRLLRCHPFGGSGYDAVPAPMKETGVLGADLTSSRG